MKASPVDCQKESIAVLKTFIQDLFRLYVQKIVIEWYSEPNTWSSDDLHFNTDDHFEIDEKQNVVINTETSTSEVQFPLDNVKIELQPELRCDLDLDEMPVHDVSKKLSVLQKEKLNINRKGPKKQLKKAEEVKSSGESDVDISESSSYLYQSTSKGDDRKTGNENTPILDKGTVGIGIMSSSPEAETFKCLECSQVFCHKRYLAKHQRTVHNPNRVCPYCGQQFTKKVKFESHVRKHTGERPFACSYCGVTFRESWHLKEHVKLVHESDKVTRHKCDHCEKTFLRRGECVRHMRVHTGEKPYQCSECGKQFRIHTQLKTHTASVHLKVKPYICSFCGAGFARKAQMNIHLRTHTGEKPYKCPECGKTFSLSKGLKNHIRIHTGEKPHVCHECGKAFTESSNLKVHILTHSGKKPYNCSVCGKGFARKPRLLQHKLTHLEGDTEQTGSCDVANTE